jgi:hypothetical protein
VGHYSICLTGSTVRPPLFLHAYKCSTKKCMLDDKNRQADTAIQTRIIAKILLRVGELPFFVWNNGPTDLSVAIN